MMTITIRWADKLEMQQSFTSLKKADTWVKALIEKHGQPEQITRDDQIPLDLPEPPEN